jgi:two-component system phosphate regulon sensor histidine kinase PhoR
MRIDVDVERQAALDDPQFASLLAGVPLPMLLIGHDLRVTAANPAAEALFGPGLTGRHYMTQFRQPAIVAAIERALAGGQVSQTRLVLTGPGRDTIYRIHCALQGPRGVSLAFEDISEIEQASIIRRDFVANVSHELRTPLTALLGFIETLRGAARDDPAARDRFLAIMAGEAMRMNRLVADLLSLSRVESEERVRPSERIDIVAVVRSAVMTQRALAEASGVAVGLTAPEGPVSVAADADQMTQVIHNLVENAIKYGGSGGKVQVAVSEDDNNSLLRGPAVSITVQDFGEGIDPIHLPRLSERFYRADAHRSRQKGGTGLGLAIVKHIMQRHRGRLRIESRQGEGSVFTVILPR